MKPLLNTVLLSFLLAIGLAGSVNGQDNDQLGFICVLKSDQTSLSRVFKVNMSSRSASEFVSLTENMAEEAGSSSIF